MTMFLLINKPAGITSHDAIAQLRKITGIKKIGHAGTLDPFAQGLLIVAIKREATKKLGQLLKLDKSYQATLQLGAVSSTYDLNGKIQQSQIAKKINLNPAKIKKIIKQFIGSQQQIPPIFSAKKINGRKAYQLARQGHQLKLEPQKINIYNIKLLNFDALKLRLKLEIECSSGTYIRSLANDIGAKLKTGAYLIKLIRARIGPFKLKDARDLSALNKNNWQKFIIKQLPTLADESRVLAFGTFDRLHPGHIYFLKQAKKLGQQLNIIIARDVNVKKIKGKTPYYSENSRLKNLKGLNLAEQIMLGSTDWQKRYRILKKIKPNIIALGYDQKINLNQLANKLKQYKLPTKIIRLKAYHPQKYKSSILNRQTKTKN